MDKLVKEKLRNEQLKMMAGPCLITFAIPLMVPGITLSLVAFDDETGFAKFSALHVIGFIFCAFSVTLLVLGCVLRFVWKSKVTPDLEQHLTPRHSVRRLSDRHRAGNGTNNSALQRIYAGTCSTNMEDSGQSSSNTLIGNGIVNKAFDPSPSSSSSSSSPSQPSSSSENQSPSPSLSTSSSPSLLPEANVNRPVDSLRILSELQQTRNDEDSSQLNENGSSETSENMQNGNIPSGIRNKIISVKSIEDLNKLDSENEDSEFSSTKKPSRTFDPPSYDAIASDSHRQNASMSDRLTIGGVLPSVENPHSVSDNRSVEEQRTIVSVGDSQGLKDKLGTLRQASESDGSMKSAPNDGSQNAQWSFPEKVEEVEMETSFVSVSRSRTPDCLHTTEFQNAKRNEPFVLEDYSEDSKFEAIPPNLVQSEHDSFSTTSEIDDSIFSRDSVLAQYTKPKDVLY